MKNIRKRHLLSSLLSGILGALLAASASADDKGAAGTRQTVAARMPVWTEELGKVALENYSLEELAAMVQEYWTPERMRNAIPADMSVPDFRQRSGWAQERLVRPEVPWTLVTKPVPPAMPLARFALKAGSPTTNIPITSGKVFFKNTVTSQDMECSAVAVNSNSKRLVATAGHCVHGGGAGGAWHDNWRFVPFYKNGAEPWGSFYAYTARTFADWIDYGKSWKGYKSDVAFVTTYDGTYGGRVVDDIGGQGFGYGGGDSFVANIFGYPGNIDNGQIMKGCVGTNHIHAYVTYNFRRISGCNFSAGASGGP